ncbi:hypothetical protein BFU36_01345 [Sulfolobus sp. A20]|nr:hypothetical protein BFU36_01345 [Sulfolobus sp. A20]TRM80922.1 hypothetical protein DJ524_05845 [Sulfolobus sp. D5]TRM87835.1 hypothetical protein DJ529_07215 [Sulfolobus sp. C3]TRM99455.1 hypothetical protein DJ530_08870 [Sulfolobus sp. E1]TRN02573.1 hypothetical protein DJ527_03545 [Sulfolobus sp. F1]
MIIKKGFDLRNKNAYSTCIETLAFTSPSPRNLNSTVPFNRKLFWNSEGWIIVVDTTLELSKTVRFIGFVVIMFIVTLCVPFSLRGNIYAKVELVEMEN